LRLIFADDDGNAAVDYAGEAVRELYPDFNPIIITAADFAEQQLRRFEKEGNEKLSVRYRLLVNYLRDRQQKFWT
jgi:hypothetical protein